MNHIMMGGVKH